MDHDFTIDPPVVAPPLARDVLQKFEEEAAVGAPQLESQGFMVSFTKQSPTRLARKNGTQYVVQVIEDDPDLGQLLIDVFMTHGYEVRWATTKAEINQALRRGAEIDVLLLDRELPDANGLNILQAIRGHPTLNTMPVIMVTGLAGPNEVAEGLIAGADGYVSKPFKLSALLKAVQLVLGIS